MPDVVILGGGLAGTTAALALADRGLSATIVEARGRLGGRAFSRALPGDAGPAVEYGGSWGAPHHHRLQALAARLSVGLIPRAELVAQAHEPAIEDATHAMAMAQWRADAAAALLRLRRGLSAELAASASSDAPVLSRMARSSTSSWPVTKRKSMRRPSKSTRLTCT
jgi:monoamine oxidase